MAIFALLALALGVAFFAYQHFSEPQYDGKRVIDWALELNGPGDTGPAKKFFTQASPEIVLILGQALSQKESPSKKTFIAIGERMPLISRARFYRLFDPFKLDRKRRAAATALELMGPKAQPALPQLAEALHDFDPAISYLAGRTLGKIGKPALPTLIAALTDGTSNAQKMAMQGLRLMGADATEAVPALLRALELPAVRVDASTTLAEIGRPAVGPLVSALQHTNSVVQSLALSALARIGPLARQAIPQLTQALEHPSPEVRSAAAQALVAIRGN